MTSSPLLAGLPDELASAILLLLTRVERVRAEGTCKGWLRFFRDPALWAELSVTDAYGELDEADVLNDNVESLCAYAAHVPGALRSIVFEDLEQEGIQEAHAFLLRTLPMHPQLETLVMPDAAFDLGLARELVGFLAAMPCLRELRFAVLLTGDEDLADLTGFFATPLAGCTANVWIDHLMFEVHNEDDDDAPSRCLAAIAGALFLCRWQRVTVTVWDPPDLESPALAALLRGFLEALQPALSFQVIDISVCQFDADEARWIARAVPAHARISSLRIRCAANEARFLMEALRPGCVMGTTLTLAGPPWAAGPLRTALAAVSAASTAALAAQEPFKLSFISSADPNAPLWSLTAAQHFADFFHDDANAVIDNLVLPLDDASLQLVLSAIRRKIETLDLAGCRVTDESLFVAVLALPNGFFLRGLVEELKLWAISPICTRALVTALLGHPPTYRPSIHCPAATSLAAVLAMLPRAHFFSVGGDSVICALLSFGRRAATAGPEAFADWQQTMRDSNAFEQLRPEDSSGAVLSYPTPHLLHCMCIDSAPLCRRLCSPTLIKALSSSVLIRYDLTDAASLLLRLLCCDASLRLHREVLCDVVVSCVSVLPSAQAATRSSKPSADYTAMLRHVLLLACGNLAARPKSLDDSTHNQLAVTWLRTRPVEIGADLLAVMTHFMSPNNTPAHAVTNTAPFWTLSDVAAHADAACALVPAAFAAPGVSGALLAILRQQRAAHSSAAVVEPPDAAAAEIAGLQRWTRTLRRVADVLRNKLPEVAAAITAELG